MLSLLVLLAACSGKATDTVDTDTDAAGGDTDSDVGATSCADATSTGTLVLSFRMNADYIEQMDEAPVGTFRGSVYDANDVTALGPNDGATPLLDFEVPGVDLSAGGGPTGAMFTTSSLPACDVSVLGCLDTDGNDCDKGDPITLPNQSYVTVAGDGTAYEVYLGLLNPG